MSSLLSFGDKLQEILSRRGAQLAKILSAKGSETEARMSKAGDTVRKNAEKAAENVKSEQQARTEGDKKKTNDAAKKSQAPQGKKQSPKQPCKKCGERDEPQWRYYKLGNPNGGGYVIKGSEINSLRNYSRWNDLFNAKDSKGRPLKTVHEKKVMCAVSGSEGFFDTVQTYDSEVATVGAMQKTLKIGGGGEFKNQLEEFKEESPKKYHELFESQGWSIVEREIITKKGTTVKDTTLQYKDPSDRSMKPLSGEELKAWLNRKEEPVPNNIKKAMEVLRDAGRDPAFQEKQVMDFNARLLRALNKKPEGYSHPTKKYLTSEKGRAMVLDTSVNAGESGANKAFGQVLDKFYKRHPDASQDPSLWPSEKKQSYEYEILEIFQEKRMKIYKNGKTLVTKPDKRNAAIMGNNELSGIIGSMLLPEDF